MKLLPIKRLRNVFPVIILILSVCTITLCAQSESQIIRKANDLITNKKYKSAFRLLNDADPKNDRPDVVLLKEHIALDDFVESWMHEMFAFKDLKPGEHIMDYRGKEGSYQIYPFSIDTVLIKLIKRYPQNCRLYKGLADFYYDAHMDFGGKWLISDDTLKELIDKNYKTVFNDGCADYTSYFRTGIISISQKRYKRAIPYFLKSIEMNKNSADSYYNLAYAYLYTNDRAHALKYAKISLGMYRDPSNKSDAAGMIGEIYTELNDYKSAIKYYEEANGIDPCNYRVMKPLLRLYIDTDNPHTAEMTDAFFHLDPDNPTIYNDLNKMFYKDDKDSLLASFYTKKLSVYKDSTKISGNLNFFLANIYLYTNKKLAKEYLMNARRLFSEVYKKDNQVFRAIHEGLRQIK